MEFELTYRELEDALEAYVRAHRPELPEEACVRRIRPKPDSRLALRPAARIAFELPVEVEVEVER